MTVGSIIRRLTESEMEKAEIVLGVKAITDDLQQMAEKISRMQIEDISALTERLKAEYGVERGDHFQQEVGAFLGTALTALQASKSSIDNTALSLTGDSGMAAGGAIGAPGAVGGAAPLPALAPPGGEEELPGGKEEDMFVGHEAGAGGEEAPLGRLKKESVDVTGKKLTEMKKFLESKGMTDSKMYKQVVALNEAWETKMHTKKKDKGMFKGKSQSEVKGSIAALKKRQEAHKAKTGKADPKITKKLKQSEFDIRAKNKFGKVNESEMNSDSSKELLMDEGSTRKHFRDVANTLKHVPDMDKRKELATSHADAFKAANDRFNHSKFYKACGLDECGDVGLMSPLSMSTKNFESTEPRKMGNPEHMAKKEVNPTTPKNTAKVLDAKAGNVKKK